MRFVPNWPGPTDCVVLIRPKLELLRLPDGVLKLILSQRVVLGKIWGDISLTDIERSRRLLTSE